MFGATPRRSSEVADSDSVKSRCPQIVADAASAIAYRATRIFSPADVGPAPRAQSLMRLFRDETSIHQKKRRQPRSHKALQRDCLLPKLRRNVRNPAGAIECSST